MKEIYRRLTEKDIALRHVCEVGVYLPETSNVIDFIKNGVPTTLVEADPVIVKKIHEAFSSYSIRVHPVAVWDHSGRVRLSKANASTFVTELKASPAVVNDNYRVKEEDTFGVECRVFSDIRHETTVCVFTHKILSCGL